MLEGSLWYGSVLGDHSVALPSGLTGYTAVIPFFTASNDVMEIFPPLVSHRILIFWHRFHVLRIIPNASLSGFWVVDRSWSTYVYTVILLALYSNLTLMLGLLCIESTLSMYYLKAEKQLYNK